MNFLGTLARRFEKPGAWLWAMVVIGVLSRAFLVCFSQGTTDISIWSGFAQGIRERGLLNEYSVEPLLNHPPFMAWIASLVWAASARSGIPFRILFRAPIAAADLGSGALLAYLFRASSYRWLILGLYAVHPLAVVLSGFHGNIDPVVALLLLGCTAFAEAEVPFWCGAVFGISLWIKIAGLLAAPALFFWFQKTRDRARFAGAAIGVGVLSYLPALKAAPSLIVQRVFGYAGLRIRNQIGIKIWGLWNLLGPVFPISESLSRAGQAGEDWYVRHHAWVAIVPILLLSWLRRRKRTAVELGATIAGCYSILYAVSSYWSFQYLAWSLPFWFLAGPVFAAGATLTAGAYVCGLYAFLCGNPLLLGSWDFWGRADWPWILLVLRDASVVFFLRERAPSAPAAPSN